MPPPTQVDVTVSFWDTDGVDLLGWSCRATGMAVVECTMKFAPIPAPEPSQGLLVGLVVLVALWGHRHRKKRS